MPKYDVQERLLYDREYGPGDVVDLTTEEAEPLLKAGVIKEKPAQPPNAKELIEKIKTMDDPDGVEALLENENRSTVIEAIKNRLAELKG